MKADDFIVVKIEPQGVGGWKTRLAATEQLWKKHAVGTIRLSLFGSKF